MDAAVTDVLITPAVVQQAATTFATEQWNIGGAWDALAATLSGCDGMAGHAPDKAAVAFAPHYTSAVQGAWRAFRATMRSVGGISLCLGATAGHYLRADHHSIISTPPTMGSGVLLNPRAQPSLPPWQLSRQVGKQVTTDKTMAMPPSVLGSAGSSLPQQLAELWPTGDPSKLRTAAAAWNAAHDRLTASTGKLGTAIYSVTEGNNTRDARAIDDVWSKLYASCNDATVLQALPDLCTNIANACTKYADAVEHAHNKAKWELVGAGVVGVVVIGAGLFFTPETGGASDAGAAAADTALAMSILGPIATALLGTVTLIAAGALAEHVIQAAENSADKAPNVQPNDADTQGLESSLEGAVKGDHDDIGAARVPDLNGKSLDEAEQELADQGFTLKNVTTGGYRHYSNPDGSEVAIRPDGEVIRLGPKIDPGPNQKNYKPRYGPDGLRTQQHSTGERVIFP
ncbi:PASTA domain-containing protein [Actinomadura sp. LD22]|uniref:PASTA domain-containing protein n=1 Tax=Actinomadura physcomitrii TaxID=2650748 RepID=A0A6I4MDY5_9ACTN|nr:PASTA domain-containing protein [Actinomadura physcomitrii]MWA02745.1 PASTA domain-containing protein [Actinomadura physcomitrii]